MTQELSLNTECNASLRRAADPETPRAGALDIRLIGGATALLEVGGLRILTDPTFDPPGDHPVGKRNLVKLTTPGVSSDDIRPIDVVLLSHDQHPDNLDDAGRRLLESVPLILTTKEAAGRLGGAAQALASWTHCDVDLPSGGSLTIYGVPAQHGPDNTEHLTGTVRGFVLRAGGMPTVYISGDNASLRVIEDIAQHVGRVDIAVLFAGAGRSPLMDAFLTLNGEGVARAADILDASAVVPVHAEGWGHFTEGTAEIVTAFARRGNEDRLVVLEVGASITMWLDVDDRLCHSL